MALSLIHSDRKGVRVLVLGNDEDKVNAVEARTENDPDLQRIDVLSVRTMIDAEKIIKQSEPLLVIYEDGFEGKDAISIQLQLRHVDKRLQFIPVLRTLALHTISQLQRIGNVYDYAEGKLLDDYAAFKNAVLDFVRQYSTKEGALTEFLAVVNPIHHSLLVGLAAWKPAKDLSKECVRALLPHYDLSVLEAASIIAADRVYFPEVPVAEYKNILGSQVPDVLEVLGATGAWKQSKRSPTSVPGFIVTAGSLMAEVYAKHQSLSQMLPEIQGKAAHLKHPAARVVTSEVINQIEASLRTRGKKVA